MDGASRWQNRIVESGESDPTQLLANPLNPRRHTIAQQDAMLALLDRVGWVQDVIVNRTTGHVVDGHLRVELAIRREEPAIPIKYVDLSEEEEKLVLLTYDPIAEMAYNDRDALRFLLNDTGEPDAEALRDVYTALARKAAPDTDGSFLAEYLEDDAGGENESDRSRDADTEDATVAFNLSMSKGQRAVILSAIKRAKQEYDVPTSQEALVHICESYTDDAGDDT